MRAQKVERLRFLLLLAATALVAAPRVAHALSCVGDCNDDGRVGLTEAIRGVTIAQGTSQVSTCTKFDADRNGAVAINELMKGVGFLLRGCPYPLDPQLRLNHMQVLASHNSYHIQPQEPVASALIAMFPGLFEVWEYTHEPLDVQFEEQGVRAIEIDVFADPEGGLYANRGAVGVLTGNPASGIPALDLPGFKVLHVQDADFETTCYTFRECLETVKDWSDAHPGHVPIMIQIEAKDDRIPNLGLGFEFVVPIVIGAEELDALDEEIRQVFPVEQVITPDEVRGGRDTLEEAVLTDGWPTLGRSRGRVFFTLDNGGAKKAAYIAGHPSLRGRILFTSSEPGEPEAGFVKLNDPVDDFDRIQELVAAGFIVRTRADSDTQQARTGDTTNRDLALGSGAHFVSTDYPVPDPSFGTGYQVQIPMGMPVGCNPISAPSVCTALALESPALLSWD
jgi:hypothetical protein